MNKALLAEHHCFQHPLYTYSCPALLKEYLIAFLESGFAVRPGKPTESTGVA